MATIRACVVVKLAGVSYRAEALQDDGVRARAPARARAASPRTSTTRTRSRVWDAERRVQAGYVPADVRAGAARRRAGGRALGVPRRGGPARRPARPARAGGRLDPGAARVKGCFSPRLRAGGDGRRRASSVSFQALNAGWHWDPGDEHRRGRRAAATRSPVRSRCAARAPGQTLVVHDRRGDAARVGRDVRATASASTWQLDGDTWRCGSDASARRRSSASSACRRPSRASTRRSRRGAGAATSTASCSSPARRSTSRSRSTARCSWRATATARRATARSPAPRSSARSSARTLTLDARRPRAAHADRAHPRRVARVRLRRGSRRRRGAVPWRRCST